MGRFATVLCVVTGIVTIIDHVRNNPFYSGWLSRHIMSTSRGWEVSPGLNFVVLIAAGAAVWLLTAPEAAPADAPTARKHAWRRSGLAAAAMAAWLGFGPAIRRTPDAAQPAAQTEAKAPSPDMPYSPFQLRPLDKRGVGAERGA